jgi:cellobiose-specific phosphotransferase system component IIA
MKITIYFGDKGVQYDNAAEAIEMLQKIERQEIANKLKLADETLNKADEIYNILVNENKKAEKSRQAVTENRKESGQRESQKVVRHYVPTNE